MPILNLEFKLCADNGFQCGSFSQIFVFSVLLKDFSR